MSAFGLLHTVRMEIPSTYRVNGIIDSIGYNMFQIPANLMICHLQFQESNPL